MLNIHNVKPLAPGQRIIFVGDIHGCSDEFDSLMATVKFQKGNDILILVGDLVNKGYDSVGVIERAIQYGAIGVLGNHDASLIARYDRIREGEIDPTQLPHTLDPMTQTAAELPRRCYKYLTDLPHIIMVPQFDVIVAHAGINPKATLQEQNLWELLHMRRILPNGRVIDAQSGGDLWATKWKGPQTIIFGHDARTGLQQHPFAIGLDTGCCYGGDLTAYVLPGKQFIKVPGSRRGVSKKPPMASPETNIGYSPSVEPVSTPQQIVAGGGAGGSSRQTPSSIPSHQPSGANVGATEALKSLLFGKNASPIPPPTSAHDGPLFPSVPPPVQQTASPNPESRAPLPRSAQTAAAAPTPIATLLSKLVPSTMVAGATVEKSGSKTAPTLVPSAPVTAPVGKTFATPQHPQAPAPVAAQPQALQAPQPVSATAAPSQAQPRAAVTQPAAAPTAKPVEATPTSNGTAAAQRVTPPVAPAATVSSSSTKATDETVVLLRRHIFSVAAQIGSAASGSSASVAATVIELLSGGPMEDHRQDLLEDRSIPALQWAALLSGLSKHITDPKCSRSVADESLLWIQDVAQSRPDALDALDRKALEGSIMLTSVAAKTVIKSTLIAVRK